MTEAEARAWLRDHFGVSRETAVADFVTRVVAEQGRQNLVSAATLPDIWRRHVVDSAQLLLRAPGEGLWIDIGTGAGFPGMIVALLSERPVLMVEPRRKRADFLRDSAAALGLTHARVEAARAQAVTGEAAVISARAVAALVDLLGAAFHLSTPKTRWLLPKGKSAREEVAMAARAWHGVFHVEPSFTDPESLIVIAEGVARR
ncbi:16S rRNA (guanine(527)-N(7))-methyltransferase RsmG [Sphingomonas sp.]|uniref:16S rRNA (guanine(527)-N(7))-methyltransferase RsmG n=1 Tax=Sphingomonas sp. TaxID=28214 RepID=UPI001DEED5E4|nr:16S rRNA (guanine(527)-N(7))-methyltransferase RsmG [Sphingomonas sp.]MBX9795507.1 16S rRNA (guanine(527)-N(7))-methyltransferase RsmG [Sphingomonas sp.]